MLSAFALQQLKRLMLSSMLPHYTNQKAARCTKRSTASTEKKKGNKQKYRHDGGKKNEREMNTDQGGVEPPQKVGQSHDFVKGNWSSAS